MNSLLDFSSAPRSKAFSPSPVVLLRVSSIVNAVRCFEERCTALPLARSALRDVASPVAMSLRDDQQCEKAQSTVSPQILSTTLFCFARLGRTSETIIDQHPNLLSGWLVRAMITCLNASICRLEIDLIGHSLGQPCGPVEGQEAAGAYPAPLGV